MRAFVLVRVAEVDLVDRDDRFTVRVEVLQDRARADVFRVRAARTDVFHLQPTYPLDVWSAPSAPPDAEGAWVRWPEAEAPPLELTADDPDAALDAALAFVAERAARAGCAPAP